MLTSSGIKRATAGFTLLEVIFVVVVLGVLTKFAMMKLVTPATMTLPAQAQAVAGLVRQAQGLAVQRGQRMCFRVDTTGANGRFAYAAAPTIGVCTTSNATCTGTPESCLSVAQGVSVGGATPVYFNSLGLPLDNTGAARTTDISFTVMYTTGSATDTKSIVVSALTGRVAVQ